MNFPRGHSGTKVRCESRLFSEGKATEFTKMGKSHELFVLALSLVWFAGATADNWHLGNSGGADCISRFEITVRLHGPRRQ